MNSPRTPWSRTAERLIASGAVLIVARRDARALRRVRQAIRSAMMRRSVDSLLMLAGAVLLGLAAQRLMPTF